MTEANAGVAPPLVEQCNDSGAKASMGLRCTIEVGQYLNGDGTRTSSLPDPVFRSLGLGGIFSVVIAAVGAALTLLPAMLGLLGDRVNWLSLPGPADVDRRGRHRA